MNPKENNPSTGLVTKIEEYKKIARETLRMDLINPRLSRIAGFKTEITRLEDNIKSNEHEIKVEEYEISKLDQDHPDYEKKKEFKELAITHLTENTERLNKNIEDLQKEVTEQEEGIAKIESGETKVSLDRLNSLVEDMTRQNALNQAGA